MFITRSEYRRNRRRPNVKPPVEWSAVITTKYLGASLETHVPLQERDLSHPSHAPPGNNCMLTPPISAFNHQCNEPFLAQANAVQHRSSLPRHFVTVYGKWQAF